MIAAKSADGPINYRRPLPRSRRFFACEPSLARLICFSRLKVLNEDRRRRVGRNKREIENSRKSQSMLAVYDAELSTALIGCFIIDGTYWKRSCP